MNRCLLDLFSDVTLRCGFSLRRATRILGVPRSCHDRWKRRAANKVPLVQSPGPRKMVAADIAAITDDIAALTHGTQRTGGTTALYKRYRDSISRRDLQAMIKDERTRQVAERREGFDEVHWQGAGIVWAMDDTLYHERDREGRQLMIHHVRDIGAHYSLQPMAGIDHPHGMEVAANLHTLCNRYGAPLFIKRDNGGNLNTPDVDEVLAQFCVIPFNSPFCTPTYNGAIERAQGTLKSELACQLAPVGQWSAAAALPYLRAAANEINHKPLDVLGGSCACQYRATHMLTFNKNERKDIYDWLTNARKSILEDQMEGVSVQTAHRWAVTAWLLKNEYMSINRH